MLLSLGLLLALAIRSVHSDGKNPIKAPLAGETVTAEKSYTIRWTPGTPGPVNIELHYADTQYVNISESTENDGNFEWKPSGVFDGKTNFYLAICDLLVKSECTYTFNGRFAISASGGSSSASSSVSRTSTISGSTSSPTATSSSTSITSSISPTSSNTAPPATPNPAQGLSDGAKIATIVVCTVVGIALLGLGLFFWYRRRQHQKSGHGKIYEESNKGNVHEIMQEHRNELMHEDRYELMGQAGRGELEGDKPNNGRSRPDVTYELPGGPR